MAFRLSVVISTFNRLALLQELLDALARQTLPPDRFEVVVVDEHLGVTMTEIIKGERA